MEGFLDAQEPGRFSKATLKSTAQNINSSWTHYQSGHLAGRVRKVRARAVATPGAASLALLLGYVSGLRGGDWLFKRNCHHNATLAIETPSMAMFIVLSTLAASRITNARCSSRTN